VQSIESIAGLSFFCSWSGGKDSCLALYHAIQSGGRPRYLFTMMTEDQHTSRSHGLPRSLLDHQARALGIPIVFRSATWDEYEASFLTALRDFKAEGLEAGVFGDIDVESNRDWCLRVCNSPGIVHLSTRFGNDRVTNCSRSSSICNSRRALLSQKQTNWIRSGWAGRLIAIRSLNWRKPALTRPENWANTTPL
jgi:diphthamide synthase (EF-2-diphthine--ammonia ligase)